MPDKSESVPVTLEMIEKHLKKVENDAIEAAFMHPMALAGAILLGGATATWPTIIGPWLMAYGAFYFVYVFIKYRQFKKQIKS